VMRADHSSVLSLPATYCEIDRFAVYLS